MISKKELNVVENSDEQLDLECILYALKTILVELVFMAGF